MPWDAQALAEANGLEPETPIEPDPPRVAEEQTIAQPGQGYQPPQQREPEPQRRPDVMEDPLGHFDNRVQDLEAAVGASFGQNQAMAIQRAVEQDEKAAEQEWSDYWEACAHLENAHMRALERQIPDGAQGDLYAHSHGLPNAAAARQAHLDRDRQLVVSWALQNGKSPAQSYYQLAQSRGYQPAAVPKSVMKRTLEAFESGDAADQDKAWDAYEKAARRAEENRRSRR